MSAIGWIHTSFAIIAIISGAFVLLQRKGTARHRLMGWTYVASMIGLNGTALLIYRLFGGFGPFHVAAIFSLLTVLTGTLTVLRRERGWVERHYQWMAYSYVGLLAAAASEAITRSPGVRFWWAVLVATAVVFAVGAFLIRRRGPAMLAPFRHLDTGASRGVAGSGGARGG